MSQAGTDLLCIPNLGAEEGIRELPVAARGGAALFEALFEPPTPFSWLAPPSGAAVAWLATEAAQAEAERAGRSLWSARPEVVRVVHDKAFAHRAALRDGYVPVPLRDLVEVFEPEALAAPNAAESIAARVAAWPAWTRGRFTLKPRWGTSGRGRLAGVSGDRIEKSALDRLAGRGGALLEPWLDRSEDLSASLWVGPEGDLVLLGTARLLVAGSGLYRGHRGWVDSKGRITSASAYDEDVREAAVALAQCAARAEYWGPCGVDAFVFAGDDGRSRLRPVVELNARFTMGISMMGWLRRLLPRLRAELRLSPEQRVPFHFSLDPPPSGWPDAAEVAAGGGLLARGSSPVDSPAAAAGVLVAPDAATLQRWTGDDPLA